MFFYNIKIIKNTIIIPRYIELTIILVDGYNMILIRLSFFSLKISRKKFLL